MGGAGSVKWVWWGSGVAAEGKSAGNLWVERRELGSYAGDRFAVWVGSCAGGGWRQRVLVQLCRGGRDVVGMRVV